MYSFHNCTHTICYIIFHSIVCDVWMHPTKTKKSTLIARNWLKLLICVRVHVNEIINRHSSFHWKYQKNWMYCVNCELWTLLKVIFIFLKIILIFRWDQKRRSIFFTIMHSSLIIFTAFTSSFLENHFSFVSIWYLI